MVPGQFCRPLAHDTITERCWKHPSVQNDLYASECTRKAWNGRMQPKDRHR
jgi:hypothetical protein